jgi:hypothetical protein
MAKEIDPVERKINMMAAASEALTYKKKNARVDNDRVLQYISRNIVIGKDEVTKMGMIAAATDALTIADKNPSMNDKQVLKIVMDNLPSMLNNIMEL